MGYIEREFTSIFEMIYQERVLDGQTIGLNRTRTGSSQRISLVINYQDRVLHWPDKWARSNARSGITASLTGYGCQNKLQRSGP